MVYQDAWANGRVLSRGYRNCESRYEIIKAFCTKFNGPFAVCDIGANMCYFGIRLTEDFPGCSVMAFEFDHFALRKAHVESSKAKRLMLLERKVSLEDVATLRSLCRFDVVLALSVLHHLPGNFDQWMTALRGLGKNLIVEFALDDSARVAKKRGYRIPGDAVVLGYCESHLKRGAQRPMVLIPNNEGETEKHVCVAGL